MIEYSFTVLDRTVNCRSKGRQAHRIRKQLSILTSPKMSCQYLSTVVSSCALETVNKISKGERIFSLVIPFLEE